MRSMSASREIIKSKPIDYTLRVADIEPFYNLLAVGIAFLLWIGLGKWRTGLLAGICS